MKLYFAVAVLLLALAALTDAQDEETFEQKFANFGTQFVEMTKDAFQKAKTTFEEIPNTEFATSIKTWWEQQFGAPVEN